MGKFDKMTDAEIYRFLLSETPSKHDLKKIEKPIELMSSDGKYSWACSMLLAFYKSEEQKAFDCIRVAEKRGLLNAEMIAALSLPWVFNGFEKTFSYTGRLFAGIFVARAYENGWGVDRDHAKAVEIAKNFINTPESDPLYEHVQELLAGIGAEREPVSAKEPVRFDEAPPYAGANKHHIEYENGDVYDGEMKDGKRHGKGRLATQFGDIYEGEFQNDKFHGHGIFKELSADEENYWCCEGEWVNGKKEGRFKCWGIVIEDGREDRFEDEFYKNSEQIENKPESSATPADVAGKNDTIHKEFSNGDVYDGEMENGDFHGKGRYASAKGWVYEGDFVNGKTFGKGRLTFDNGTYYEGSVTERATANGYGKKTYPDGSYYEGEWKDNHYHGKGRLTFKDGTYEEGTYISGKLEGLGTFTFYSGEYLFLIEGQFVEGRKEGRFEGVVKNGSSGKTYLLFYHDDKEVGRTFKDEMNKNWTTDDYLNHQAEVRAKREADERDAAKVSCHSESEEDDEAYEEDEDADCCGEDFDSLDELKKVISCPQFFTDSRDIMLMRSCKYFDPYKEDIIDLFDNGDKRKAAFLLADILEIDPLKTYEHAAEGEGNALDFIFRGLKYASTAIKPSASPYLANLCFNLWLSSRQEIVYDEVFTYPVYDDDFLDPIINYYGFLGEKNYNGKRNYSEEEGCFATYIIREREHNNGYSRITDTEVHNMFSYIFDQKYGQKLDDLFDDGFEVGSNCKFYIPPRLKQYVRYLAPDHSKLYDLDDKEINPDLVSFVTKLGHKFTGYINEQGNCNGWSILKYSDNEIYYGVQNNGYKDIFGIGVGPRTIYYGQYSAKDNDSIGVMITRDFEIEGSECPIVGTYYRDGKAIINPAFAPYCNKPLTRGAFDGWHGFEGTVIDRELQGYGKIWSVDLDFVEYQEGIFEDSKLVFGIDVKQLAENNIGFSYGRYDPESHELYTLPGETGIMFHVSDWQKVSYQEGQFKDGCLVGNGLYLVDGVQIYGYFENGDLTSVDRIERIIKKDGKEGDPKDFDFLLTKYIIVDDEQE